MSKSCSLHARAQQGRINSAKFSGTTSAPRSKRTCSRAANCQTTPHTHTQSPLSKNRIKGTLTWHTEKNYVFFLSLSQQILAKFTYFILLSVENSPSRGWNWVRVCNSSVCVCVVAQSTREMQKRPTPFATRTALSQGGPLFLAPYPPGPHTGVDCQPCANFGTPWKVSRFALSQLFFLLTFSFCQFSIIQNIYIVNIFKYNI